MNSITKQLILRAFILVSLIGSIVWFFYEPKFESFLTFLGAMIFFIRSYNIIKHSNPSDKMKSDCENIHRKQTLENVENSFIKDVLEQSPHRENLITLGLEERRDAVLNQRGIGLQRPRDFNYLLPPGTGIIDVFYKNHKMGQSLLILGEAGSGKTIMLLKLTQDAIYRAKENNQYRIPVVLNLSSWTNTTQTIADWLVDELNTDPNYRIPRETVSNWIKCDVLLPLLDGLDEVLPERREACANAINDFRSNHGLTPIVVCCRSEDYKTLTTRLDFGCAISLQPLTKEQINGYLDRMGSGLAALRMALKTDSELCGLARTPLMLSIMALAYQGLSDDELKPLETDDARQKHIFENYVKRMFKPRAERTLPNCIITDFMSDRKQDNKRFSKEDTIRWLSWLAIRMSQNGQSEFFIEGMQPDWLPREQQRLMNKIVTLTCGLFSGLIGGLVLGMAFGQEFGQDFGVITTLIFGLSGALCFGLFFGLLGMWMGHGKNYIQPVESLQFSWSKMLTSSSKILISGVLLGLLRGVSNGFLDGLFSGFLAILFFGMSYGLQRREILIGKYPNEGMHKSARSALLAGLVGGLSIGTLSELFYNEHYGMQQYGLFIGLCFFLLFWMQYGGRAVVQHIVLRIMLWRLGYLPLNYSRFLDYADKCIFLHKAGGMYIFHGPLREYFASLEKQSN